MYLIVAANATMLWPYDRNKFLVAIWLLTTLRCSRSRGKGEALSSSVGASSKVKVESSFHRWASFIWQKYCDDGFDHYAFFWWDDRPSEHIGWMVGSSKVTQEWVRLGWDPTIAWVTDVWVIFLWYGTFAHARASTHSLSWSFVSRNARLWCRTKVNWLAVF